MKTLPATVEDALYILEHLSVRNREEHAVARLSSHGAAKLIHDFMGRGEAVVGLLDDKPAAVFGIIDGDLNRYTWFMATEDFWKQGSSGVRFCRKFLGECDLSSPIFTVTCSPHPAADRWFKLLGYEKVGEEGIFRWFKYSPKDHISQPASVKGPEVAAPDTLEPVD